MFGSSEEESLEWVKLIKWRMVSDYDKTCLWGS